MSVDETANVDFPVSMPERVLLLLTDVEVFIEGKHLDISCAALLLPILQLDAA